MTDPWLLRSLGTGNSLQIPGLPGLGGDAGTEALGSLEALTGTAATDLFAQGGLPTNLQNYVNGFGSPMADPMAIFEALSTLPGEAREVGALNNQQQTQGVDPALNHGGDAAQKAALQEQIKELMQWLEANGIDLEARPGSRLAEAQKSGDYSNLTAEDLISVLQSLQRYQQNQQAGGNPGAVAGGRNTNMAPRGSWKPGGGGNTYGGGTNQSGANANSGNAPTQIDNTAGAPRAPGQSNAPWISQFDGSRVERAGSKACYRACRAMMAAAGVPIPAGTGNRIQVAQGEDGSGRVRTNRGATDQARGYIDQQLAAGKPVTVGVSHKDANYNQDGITDHFVTITGQGVDDQGRQFYTYNDPATQNRATGQNQRFYVDANSGNLVHQGSLASGYVVNRHTEMSMVIRNS